MQWHPDAQLKKVRKKCKLSGRILKDEVCARGTANGLPRYEFQEPKRDKNKTPHP